MTMCGFADGRYTPNGGSSAPNGPNHLQFIRGDDLAIGIIGTLWILLGLVHSFVRSLRSLYYMNLGVLLSSRMGSHPSGQ